MARTGSATAESCRPARLREPIARSGGPIRRYRPDRRCLLSRAIRIAALTARAPSAPRPGCRGTRPGGQAGFGFRRYRRAEQVLRDGR